MDHRYIAAALSPQDARRVYSSISEADGRTPHLALDGVDLEIDESGRRAVMELLRQLASGPL